MSFRVYPPRWVSPRRPRDNTRTNRGGRTTTRHRYPGRDPNPSVPNHILQDSRKRTQGKTTQNFEETVPKCYHEYKDIFSKEAFDELPPRRPWDHAIEIIPGAEAIDSRIYPLNREEQKQLDAFLEENLTSGRIRPSKSPMAAPFFFVKKKDGSLRPVQDYRRLNIDIRWGFNNVRIKEGDEWKAAFRTNRGLFEPLVMFFGLKNSPATFQTMMNALFRDLITEGHVVIYMDDILIFTETLEQHRHIVKQVLRKLRENKLFAKPEKCSFEQSEVEYLGVIVSHNQVRMDPRKIRAVKDWPAPKNVKEVQQFLGFANFYRRFIEGFGGLARPLSGLTGKKDWEWGKEQNEAFEAIKGKICSAPVLTMPNDNGMFRIECDSSDFAIGAILSQQQVDMKWKPVAYLSHALNPTERNYEIYDKELLAVMTALSEWRQYLLGAKETFEIFTDHKNLEYFQKPQKLNRRQARWVTEMQEYDFTLHHKPGKTMTKADALSRRAGHDKGQSDNENVTVLKEEWFRTLSIESDQDLLNRIRKVHKNRDKSVAKALSEKLEGWSESEDGIVTWKDRLYVPVDRKLREEIVRLHHNVPTAGHPGRHKTHELITRNYWWPKIQEFIRTYVEGCEAC